MLCGQLPPIQKMDGNLGRLVRCEQLGISSNNIEKITGLKALKNLKILSIGRNCLKKFDGVGLLCIFSVSLLLAMFFYIFPFIFFCPFLFFYRLLFHSHPLACSACLVHCLLPVSSIFLSFYRTPHSTVLSSSSATYKKNSQIDFRITKLRVITFYYTHKRMPTQRK